MNSQHTAFSPRESAVFRLCWAVAGAVALLVGFASRSIATMLGALLASSCWVFWGAGLVYCLRRKLRLALLNCLLLLLTIVAVALTLPVFTPSLVPLATLLKAYWWVLFTAGGAVLWVMARAVEVRRGSPAAARVLRWLAAAQILFLAALGAAMALTGIRPR